MLYWQSICCLGAIARYRWLVGPPSVPILLWLKGRVIAAVAAAGIFQNYCRWRKRQKEQIALYSKFTVRKICLFSLLAVGIVAQRKKRDDLVYPLTGLIFGLQFFRHLQFYE
ncbi:MAG: hypothetical protein J7J76_09315 [Candidatus Latescibacteria bacterium]|nr:hypothetical protein [Candidatus Latescibacterota bacterium]